MMAWWVWVACAVGDPELLVGFDAARTGEDGQDGTFGAARVELSAPGRVSEVVPVDVIFPTEAVPGDQAPEPAVTDAPVVVLIHGGLVPPERYWWLGSHFASRGFVTVLPRAELDLAITQPGNGALALAALRRQAERAGLLQDLVPAEGPVAVAGHSLGGVMAARQWVDDASIDLLVLLAAFPAAGDDVESQAGRPVIGVSGTTDALLGPDEFVERLTERFSDAALWLVPGLNHFGWTDDARPGELDRDGPLEGDRTALREAALSVIDANLDVQLTGVDRDLAGPFPGAEAVMP
ncbi:MAG: alpha/beta fold hydrolase [Myxococcota bacterium]